MRSRDKVKQEVQDIIRNASKPGKWKARPKKEDRSSKEIVQWDTLPKLPSETELTGPVWRTPKVVDHIDSPVLVPTAQHPSYHLPLLVPPPHEPKETITVGASGKKKKEVAKTAANSARMRAKASSAPPPEHKTGMGGAFTALAMTGKLKHRMRRNSMAEDSTPIRAPFVPLSRTEESRRYVEAFFKEMADPALVEMWLKKFDEKEREVARRQARALSKQIEQNMREREIAKRQKMFLGVSSVEDLKRTSGSAASGGAQRTASEESVAQPVEGRSLASTISRTVSEAPAELFLGDNDFPEVVGARQARRNSIQKGAKAAKTAHVNWTDLKRFFRLKPQLDELRNNALNKAVGLAQNGVVNDRFEKLKSGAMDPSEL